MADKDVGTMLVTYGEGQFQDEARAWQGRIMLSDHKLYLAGAAGDVTGTYIPLEKIIRVRRVAASIIVNVRLSPASQYEMRITAAKRQSLKELLNDLVTRRQLRRRFLRAEWFDPEP